MVDNFTDLVDDFVGLVKDSDLGEVDEVSCVKYIGDLTPKAQDRMLEAVYNTAEQFKNDVGAVSRVIEDVDSHLLSPMSLAQMTVKDLLSVRNALHKERMDKTEYIRKVVTNNPVVKYADDKREALVSRLGQLPLDKIEELLDALDG